MTPLTVPFSGLTRDQWTVSCWFVRPGDVVVSGDRLVELASGEFTFDVSSPVSGRLVQVACDVDEPVWPGSILGSIAID